ncbi:dipeptidase PepV [Thalassobacillus pellis]|uniref:dipeptidase PepV n=1 Tax=Thalassobacillus pellis TaxID=748008 RepID=UPI001960B9BC|nr:dipeptidase PepV [Thalassobacillus pellis]MBM7554911.1 succinyl-diaminopimelate desuccinylase [Thalassobacillus pellis]
MHFQKLAENYEKEFLEKVTRVLRVPSVYEFNDHFPFGKPINDVLELMLKMGAEDGFEVKNIDGYAGHIEWGSGEDLIGVLGHLDVVPAGDGWDSDPFEPLIKNGNLYARGAQDDKGPVLAAYIAMKLLKDQGFRPNKRIRLIVGTDEERDWKGIKYYFDKEEMPTFGFSPDAAFPVIHAEKGLIDGYLSIPFDANEDGIYELLDFSGGDRLNMVPDQASARLRVPENNVVKDKFEAFLQTHHIKGKLHEERKDIELSVEGKGAHASKPEQGKNAIILLAKFLTEIPLPENQQKCFMWIINHFCDTKGTALGMDISDEVSGALTLNLGSLHLDKSTLIAGVNIRYPISGNREAVVDGITHKAQIVQGSFKLYDHLESLYVNEENPEVQLLLNIYNEQTGENEKVMAIGGATYARSLETGVAYGAMFPDSPDTAHQKNEHVRIKDMIRAISIYAESLYRLTR